MLLLLLLKLGKPLVAAANVISAIWQRVQRPAAAAAAAATG